MKGLTPKTQVPAGGVVSDNAEVIARDLIVRHPEMNATTFLNSLQAAGVKLVKEADNSSANVAALRPRESRGMTLVCPMVESTAAERGMVASKFKVVMLREGLGNFGDAFFYTKEALESGVSVFEGKKIYANHPRKSDEEDLPERDVRDVVGYYSDVMVESGQDGQSLLTGVVNMMPDKSFEWARALMREAVEYSKKYPNQDFVGLSINANGESSEMPLETFMRENAGLPEPCMLKLKQAVAAGVETVRVATNFTEAVSCDLVTEAGAGGKVIAMLEGERKMAKKVTKNKESDGSDAGHDDAAKDKELISAMLKKHLGEEKQDEATEKAATEAYQAARESGMEAEEAAECVGQSMKMSKILAGKKEAAEKKEGDDAGAKEESKEAEEKKESSEKKETKESNAGSGGKEKTDMKDEVMTLRGEVAVLREAAVKRDVKDKIETLCRESGMSRKATQIFREGVKDAKSESEVEKAWGTFKKGYDSHGGEAGESDFVETSEKGGASGNVGGADFSDCVAE
jgi:hypothetical protein